jgi:threonine dehydratase
VSMERGPVMYWSLRAGHAVQLAEKPTLADSLMGGFGPQNHYTIDLVRRYVDYSVLVTEADIADAMDYALNEERLVVEGGGAVGIAALRQSKAPVYGDHIVVVISGGNADMAVLRSLSARSTVEFPSR